MEEYIQVITTLPKREDAERVATMLVKERLAGCAQVVGPIASTYWWKGKMETAEEWMCVLKSRMDLYEALEEAIRKVHPYQVPEILAVPVVAGNRAYIEWLDQELKPASQQGA